MTHEKPSSSDETNFGFESVSFFDKKRKVIDLFNRVSSSYDLMNDVMSGGLHRVWKDIFVKRVSPIPQEIILDLASGTGDISYRLLKASHQKIFLFSSDLSFNMLQRGQQRMIDEGFVKNIFWTLSNAEAIPFRDHFFDKITLSFGLRNVANRLNALSEIHRVLKPKGSFFCLEFSRPLSEPLRKLYTCYSFGVIPLLGHFVAHDKKAYQYLVESIQQFPSQEDLLKEMQAVGFKSCTYENLMGGICAIHTGTKL